MLFLLLQLGTDYYAIQANQVVEVLPVVKLKTLPQAPAGVAGVFTYRGRSVPVLDLVQLTLGRPAHARRSTRLLVVNYPDGLGGHHQLGLIAEHATETLRREGRDFVETGVKNDGAPYLGPVTEDARGLIQWVRIEKLIPPPVRDLLFNQLAEAEV